MIELRHRSLWLPGLVCVSSHPQAQGFGFSYSRRKKLLLVTQNGAKFASTDGYQYLEYNGTRFAVRSKRQLWIFSVMESLHSDSEVFNFRWAAWDKQKCDGRGEVHISRTIPTEAVQHYLVQQDQSFVDGMYNKVTIANEQPTTDIAPLMACLSFFWLYFERQRLNSG
jgi:hypothetical protein